MLAWLSGSGRLQFLKQMSLAVRQPLGHVDLKPDAKVASRTSAEVWQTLPMETQDRVGLSAGRHVDGHLAIEERHVPAGAEDGVNDIDGLGAVKITAAPLEPRIFGGANDDEKIAGWHSRLVRRQAMAWNPQRCSVFHAYGNAQGEGIFVCDFSRPCALWARSIDDLAAAAAVRACRDLL